MSVVIKVENISKRYHLGKLGTNSLRGDFQRWWARKRGKEDPFSSVIEASQIQGEEFWALKDINFEIRQGEAVGIIGKNGAGKSTLLKLLSRITLPTTGSIKIKGRIASLLEVGTGFNPDLTGRENIYLNGAILGMTKAEITKKFDEIVDFSGIERFIDTPVKRYSSGMYVRLAFAVAAHLESEILILDEVLAVGDAEFQKKCLGKMDDVAHKQGRTILFVSHNMAAVANLCNSGVFLKSGTVAGIGDIRSVLLQYNRKDSTDSGKVSLNMREDRQGNGIIRFVNIELVNIDNIPILTAPAGDTIKFRLTFVNTSTYALRNFRIDIGLNNAHDERIAWFSTDMLNSNFNDVSEEVTTVYLTITKLPFMPGKYSFTLFSTVDGEIADWITNAFDFVIDAGDFFNTGKLVQAGQGLLLVDHKFELEAGVIKTV